MLTLYQLPNVAANNLPALNSLLIQETPRENDITFCFHLYLLLLKMCREVYTLYRAPSQHVEFNTHPPSHLKRWIAIQGNRMNHSAPLYEQFKMTALQNICELRIKTLVNWCNMLCTLIKFIMVSWNATIIHALLILKFFGEANGNCSTQQHVGMKASGMWFFSGV